MRPLRSSLAAITAALALAAAPASAQFTSIYYFGDSLTDSGTYKPLVPPGTGLFTTNPGPVWSQVLASRSSPIATTCRISSARPPTSAA